MIIYLKIEILYISRYRYTDVDVYILRYLYTYICIYNYHIYDLYSAESWDTDKQNKIDIVDIIKVQTDK